MRKRKYKYIITILVMIICILFLFSRININIFNGNGDYDISKSKEITTEQIIEDYMNEAYGDKFYKNRVVIVTGKIETVEQVKSHIYVTLYSDNYSYDNVLCNMKLNQKEIISNYKTDTKIKIVGIVEGKFYDVCLNKCEVIEE